MDEQTEEERQKAILAAQETETHLFRLTEMALQYRQAEARHHREQSRTSWQHKEEVGNMYEQETQWFYDHDLFPQWSEDEKRFTGVKPMPQKP